MFAPGGEHDARGDDRLRTGGPLEELLGDRGRGKHLFEVVQDEQDRPVAQVLLHRVQDGPRAVLGNAERLGDRRGHERRVPHAREVHVAHAVGEGPLDVRRRADRKTSLAAASRAGQRDKPAALEEPLDLGDLRFAPNEGRELCREVAGPGPD